MEEAIYITITVIANIAVPMFICYRLARHQGRSWHWAFLGVLHVVGIIVIALLPYPVKKPSEYES